MQVLLFKCDNCHKSQEGLALPTGWVAMQRGFTGGSTGESHFCCLTCAHEYLTLMVQLQKEDC